MNRLAAIAAALLACTGCWPYILDPSSREDIPLEGDATPPPVDTDTDTDPSCPRPDADLGNDLGDALASGNTCVGIDDFEKSCGGVPGPDVAFAWRAPQIGTYQIDLGGSDYDTVLTLYTPCPNAEELVCVDDFEGAVTSGVVRDFVDEEPVVIVVEGYANACGNFRINIQELGRSAAADTGAL